MQDKSVIQLDDHEYEMLSIPGESSSLQIAVLPSVKQLDMAGHSGMRFPYEWTAVFSSLPPLILPLHGWHAETSRDTGVNVSTPLQTAARVVHSELLMLLPADASITDFENRLSNGGRFSRVYIAHVTAVNGRPLPIQINTFCDCFVIRVKQIDSYTLVGLRITAKDVKCLAFKQDGSPWGSGVFSFDFRSNRHWSVCV